MIRDEKGGILLEFVFSTLLLVFVFAGIVNMGLLYKDRLVLASAVREAGRIAAVHRDFNYAEQYGLQVLQKNGLSGKIDININGYFIDVAGEADAPILIPGFAALLGGKAWDSTVKMKDTKRHYFEPPS